MTTKRPLIDINNEDWSMIADQVFQHEPLVDGLGGRPIHTVDLLAHIAGLTGLVRRLLIDRREFAEQALAAGATLGDVRQAMGLDTHTGAAQFNATALTVPAPREPMPECIDCGHQFNPDTSPDLDRCWMCAEHAEDIGR